MKIEHGHGLLKRESRATSDGIIDGRGAYSVGR